LLCAQHWTKVGIPSTLYYFRFLFNWPIFSELLQARPGIPRVHYSIVQAVLSTGWRTSLFSSPMKQVAFLDFQKTRKRTLEQCSHLLLHDSFFHFFPLDISHILKFSCVSWMVITHMYLLVRMKLIQRIIILSHFCLLGSGSKFPCVPVCGRAWLSLLVGSDKESLSWLLFS